MELLRGEEVVNAQIEELKERVKPGTVAVVIQVGEDSASNVYVRNKIKLCHELGLEARHIKLPESITEAELLSVVDECNEDKTIHGVLVQLPLPDHINAEAVATAIHPLKDIDCFSSYNLGEVVKGNESISPCTPKGILTILSHYGLDDLKGKTVVVVGRSLIVGKPLVNLLISRGATVINCNSNTRAEHLRRYIAHCDIFISAIGKANYFNKDFFTDVLHHKRILQGYLDKSEVEANVMKICKVAIDVGINRDSEGKLCGDISRDIYEYFDYVTPVPGGVGRTTVLELMRNIINCREMQK